MVVLHSFLIKFSLRTGATVGIIITLGNLLLTVVLAIINSSKEENIFQVRTILLLVLWFCCNILALFGVYMESSTCLIPDLSVRVLLLFLDVMGMIANYFKTELENMPVPDIGLQWYTVISATAYSAWYYVLLCLFIFLIPVKIYVFFIILSYYMVLHFESETAGAASIASTASDE